MEGIPTAENPIKQIEELIGTENSREAIPLIERLPDSETKCELSARVGADLVDQGDIETAIKIAEELETKEEWIEYSGGLIKYIGVDRYYENQSD